MSVQVSLGKSSFSIAMENTSEKYECQPFFSVSNFLNHSAIIDSLRHVCAIHSGQHVSGRNVLTTLLYWLSVTHSSFCWHETPARTAGPELANERAKAPLIPCASAVPSDRKGGNQVEKQTTESKGKVCKWWCRSTGRISHDGNGACLEHETSFVIKFLFVCTLHACLSWRHVWRQLIALFCHNFWTAAGCVWHWQVGPQVEGIVHWTTRLSDIFLLANNPWTPSLEPLYLACHFLSLQILEPQQYFNSAHSLVLDLFAFVDFQSFQYFFLFVTFRQK